MPGDLDVRFSIRRYQRGYAAEANEVELSQAENQLPRKARKALIKERQLAEHEYKGEVEMLFNLRDDIGESKNLITQHPEIADRLRKQLAAFSTEFKKTSRSAGVAE